jgi:hypothetical protein
MVGFQRSVISPGAIRWSLSTRLLFAKFRYRISGLPPTADSIRGGGCTRCTHAKRGRTWLSTISHPGTLLVIPVGDLSQHVLLNLCYMLQNGLVLTEDVNARAVPGIEKFRRIIWILKSMIVSTNPEPTCGPMRSTWRTGTVHLLYNHR